MEYTDLSKYGLTYKSPEKLLQKRGIVEADIVDLPYQIVNLFSSKYCDYGVSLCLYEPFTENPSFYAFLLVKNRSVLQDEEVRKHESIYQSEKNGLLTFLSNAEGREIKEQISFEQTHKQAYKQFFQYVYTSLATNSSIYYWIKLNEINNITLAKEQFKKYYINAVSMLNEANILILTAVQDYEEE